MFDNELGKKIRLVALWVMLVTLIAGNLSLYANGQYVWALFLNIILLLVAAFEIYGYFISPQKMTISNMWKQWAKKSPVWSYATLIIIAIGLNALIVHLWFF